MFLGGSNFYGFVVSVLPVLPEKPGEEIGFGEGHVPDAVSGAGILGVLHFGPQRRQFPVGRPGRVDEDGRVGIAVENPEFRLRLLRDPVRVDGTADRYRGGEPRRCGK